MLEIWCVAFLRLPMVLHGWRLRGHPRCEVVVVDHPRWEVVVVGGVVRVVVVLE